MIRTRYLILFMVFLALLLTAIVHAESINDLAYQNRFLLKAGTILNDEQNGEWTGIGDCLIFPYYDARQVDGMKQTTLIKIKNISEYGIVAKFRVRESSLGAEVFSKDIWIPSSSLSDDVGWQGTIEINAAGNNAVISSFDSIVSRNDTNSFYLSNSLSSGIPFSTRNIQKKNSGSILYGSIEVIGEEKTSPQNINGKVGRLASTERDCPNTLMGKGIVNRPDEGVSMAYDAVAIGNFSRGQGSLFKSIGSLYPRLDTCEDTLDQLEFQLSKSEIYAPYALDPSNQGKTSLIIAYPTKFFHYQNGSRISQVNNPFEGQTQTQGEQIDTALSGQGQAFVDSSITLPYSVNVIGLYKDYNGKPFGIDNVTMPVFSSEFGEATLTSGNLSQRVLIADYEYYKEGRFMMYKGLPAVGLVLQESQDAGQVNATLTAVEYSTNWIASNVEVISTPATPSGPVFGLIGTSYAFTASGSSSSLGHPIEYQFDWTGDGSTDLSSWGADTQFKAWAAGGVFTVRARARCTIDTSIVSKWSNGLIVTIETVSAPTLLSGPTVGIPNQSYSYTASGAFSNAGHSLQYQFDWGDGTTSPWGSGTQSKAWTTGGSYQVKARARCATDTTVVSDWTSGLTVVIEMVSTPSTPVGPSFGDLGVSYSFSTGGSVSNTGQSVEYQFDWGDGTFSSWGSSTQSKSWNRLGTFIIKAKARCVTDQVESDWSSGLTFVIETISTPSPPSGPTNGIKGIPYSYSAGGAISSSNDTLEYQFDWNGDGATDLSPWGGASQTKAWTNSGTYTVRVRARSSTHPTIVTGWSQGLVVVIEFVNPPMAPTGPTSGSIAEIYSYLTGGASSDLGDPIEYQFDWGDGTTSGWLPTGTMSMGKAWTDPGTYTVKAHARCSIHTGVVSDWSPGIGVTISTSPPPGETILIPSPPTGPTYGTKGVSYTYTTIETISTIGDPVEYQFDWGDGTFSSWGGVSQSNIWSTSGLYTVRVRARCQIHPTLVTDWSAGLQVGIEFVSTPATPIGSTSGTVGDGYSYSTGGSSSDLGPTHPIQYQFDWGDGSTSEWLPVGTTSIGKAWADPGTYIVMAHARCAIHGIVSSWSQELLVTMNPGPPPQAETISTPFIETVGDRDSIYEVTTNLIAGRKNISYSFTFQPGVSNLGNSVEHQFDWGDGTFSLWGDSTKAWPRSSIDPSCSSLSCPLPPGCITPYVVKVIARDVDNPTVMSDWSSGLNVVIDYVTPPTIPVWVNAPSDSIGYVTPPSPGYYTFSTGGSTSEICQPIQYRFDWGDGTDSGWLPVGTLSASHVWTLQGTYTIRAEARGWWYLGAEVSTQHFSDYSQGLSVTIRPTEVVSPPSVVSGPIIGIPNTVYPYTTGGAVSSLGHPVQYFFDWGDGTDSNWLPVGTTSATKSWPNGGTYNVRVKAMCATDTSVVSAWSTVLVVKIELISIPTTPVGPSQGIPGNTFTYMTGGASSNINTPIEYQIDWAGDGSDLSSWQTSTSFTKTWAQGGNFQVKARARDASNTSIMSNWSSGLTVKIELITVSTPTGSTPVLVNNSGTYSATGNSNIGDPVQIRFIFSDGIDSGFLPVGTTSFTRLWTLVGSFTVTAQARSAVHTSSVSALSAPLAVAVNNPVPTTTSISPASKTAGDPGFTLTVNGTNFVSTSVVRFGGSDRTTTFVSATQLTAAILTADLTTAGTVDITVFNPTPGGGTSNARTLTIAP